MVKKSPSVCVELLSKCYYTNGVVVRAVDNVSLSLESGTFTALVGQSGCGKSTLLRLIAGLDCADVGRVSVEPASAVPAVVFQDPRLLPWMTVRQNLDLALRNCPGAPFHKAECAQRTAEAVSLVSLSDRIDAYPHELSGGMAQRAGLARALVRQSGLLLLDEPFSALDAITRNRLQRDLKVIWEMQKSTVLFITHDIAEAVHVAHRIVLMHGGRIIDDIPVDTSHPESTKATVVELMEKSLRVPV